MGKSNFAVFVDLENVGAKESLLLSIIEKVKIRGDILLGKVYGYTDRYTEGGTPSGTGQSGKGNFGTLCKHLS